MSLRYKQKRRERYYRIKFEQQNYAYATCHDDYGMDDDDELPYCWRCSNTGYINCYCGGDLCVCMNHGEMPCPECDNW